MSYKKYILLICLITSVLLQAMTNLSELENIAACFSVYSLLSYLYTLGKKINVLELALLVFSVQLLFMPVITYVFNPEAMAVNSTIYFSYNLPAVLALAVGFEVDFYNRPNHQDLIENVRKYLINKSLVGIILFYMGLTGVALTFFVPVSLRRPADLLANTLYISVLYSYYSKDRYKYFILTVTIALMIMQTIREGMFNHFFYWGLLWIGFVAVGKRWANTMAFKLSSVLFGLAFIVLMQSVKFEYRQSTWGNRLSERRGDSELMQKLVIDNLTDFDKHLNSEIMLNTFARLNEGYYIANVMAYVPHYEPYAEGEVLLHFLYPFIPRIFWRNKPITGGYLNMSRFTNIVNNENTSTNISPVGEAYVNFGNMGGIIFMLLFGLFFNFIFQYVIKISSLSPSIFLWIPSFFVGLIIGSETDILTIWGTFVSASIFLLIFMQFFKRININI